MGIILRIRQPMESDIQKVAIQSSSANTGSGVGITGSPFDLKTGGVWVTRFEDPSGTLSRYYRFAFVDDGGVTGSWSDWFKPTGSTYCQSRDVWDWLNYYNNHVNISCGTGDGTASFYSIPDVTKIIDGTYELKYGSTSSWTELTEDTDYNLDLEKGWIKLTTAGISAISGSVLYFDGKSATIPDHVVKSMIQAADAHIENQTSRRWHKLTKTEYLDAEYGQDGVIDKDLCLCRFPVITVNTVSMQEGAPGSSDSWKNLTEGYDKDWYADEDDLKNGFIHATGENVPGIGKRMWRVNYDHGYEQIPQNIKTLSTQLTLIKIMQHPIWGAAFIKGKNTFINLELAPLKADVDLELRQLRANHYGAV